MTNNEISYKAYNEIMRGDIYFADLNGSAENGKHVQGKSRPVLIVQNNVGNRYSPNVIVVPFSSKTSKNLPTHVLVEQGNGGLQSDSIALCENPVTLGKEKLTRKIGKMSEALMEKINHAIKIALEL